MRRSLPRRLFLAFFTLLALFGMFEVAAQILRRQAPDWFSVHRPITIKVDLPFVADEQLMWRLTSGVYYLNAVTYLINSQGWRGPEIEPRKGPDGYRLMTLGGSVVYGMGVAEQAAFPYLAGTRLAERRRRRVEVINGATPGYSSTQIRAVFENHVEDYRPDAVILSALDDDLTPVRWSDQELLHELTPLDLPAEGAAAWWRKSALLHFIHLRGAAWKDDDRETMLPWSEVRARASEGVKVRVSHLRHADNIRAILEGCRTRDIRVCILLEDRPSTMRVPDPRRERYRESIRRIAEDFNVPLIDLSRLLRRYSQEELREMFPDGLHPNEQVHDWIAGQVVECLSE